MNSTKRVLVVDDNEINRMLASHLMANLGWRSAEAEDGIRALEILERDSAFDLVLLDISMPGINGMDVCRRIRAEKLGGESLPVVAYTAHAMPEETQQFLECGFDHLLIKPINLGHMKSMLATLGLLAAENAQ